MDEVVKADLMLPEVTKLVAVLRNEMDRPLPDVRDMAKAVKDVRGTDADAAFYGWVAQLPLEIRQRLFDLLSVRRAVDPLEDAHEKVQLLNGLLAAGILPPAFVDRVVENLKKGLNFGMAREGAAGVEKGVPANQLVINVGAAEARVAGVHSAAANVIPATHFAAAGKDLHTAQQDDLLGEEDGEEEG